MTEKKIRVGVDLFDEMAAAFLSELGARVADGGSSSRADMARDMIADGLRARGHKVPKRRVKWGGHMKARSKP